MATSHSTAFQSAPRHKALPRNDRSNSLRQGLSEAWQQIMRAVFDTYRPELHYMRGPGPACASKRSKSES